MSFSVPSFSVDETTFLLPNWLKNFDYSAIAYFIEMKKTRGFSERRFEKKLEKNRKFCF